jgi:hypothetical protein
MDFEHAKRKTNIELLNMETQAAREAMNAKLNNKKADANLRKYQFKNGMGMFFTDNGKYDIDSAKDRETIRELIKKNGNAENLEAFNKLIEQYEAIGEEIDEINKLQEELNNKAKNASKNRTSKWWNAAKKLAGEFASYAPKEDATLEEYQEIIAKQLMAQGKINGSKEFSDAMAQAWKDNRDAIKALPIQ